MKPRTLFTSTIAAFTALCLLPLIAEAQGTPSTVVQVYSSVIKPGLTAKFVEGFKTVLAYIKSQGGQDSISTFEIVDGPQRGTIVTLVPTTWAQLDNPPPYAAELGRQIDKNIAPYQASLVNSLARVATNLGTVPPANSPSLKYYQVYYLDIKPGQFDNFLAAVTQITAAEHKQNPSTNPVFFYFEVSGGDANRVTVAIGHPNYADFGVEGKSIAQVLREAYGEDAGSAVARQLDESVVHEENFIVQYRPDLSYTPTGH